MYIKNQKIIDVKLSSGFLTLGKMVKDKFGYLRIMTVKLSISYIFLLIRSNA